MHELCLRPKSSCRAIGLLFLGLFAFTYPALAQNQELTPSLGGIPRRNRIRDPAQPKRNHGKRNRTKELCVADPHISEQYLQVVSAGGGKQVSSFREYGRCEVSQ